MVIVNPIVDITILTVATVVISRAIQFRFMPPHEMEAHKQKINKKQEQIKKLMNNNTEEATKKIEKIQKEMIELNARIMKKTFPSIILNLPLFIGVLWFLGAEYGNIVIKLPFYYPWIDGKAYNTTNYFGVYFVVVIITGIIISQLIKKRKQAKK